LVPQLEQVIPWDEELTNLFPAENPKTEKILSAFSLLHWGQTILSFVEDLKKTSNRF